MTDDGIQPSALIASVPVILLHNQLRAVYVINPVRDFAELITLTITGDRIDSDNALDIRTVEQHDLVLQNREGPERTTGFIQLKVRRSQHITRIFKSNMSGQIIIQIRILRVLDPVLHADNLGVLRLHIHGDVRRNALAAVEEPFDQTNIIQRLHADRCAVDRCLIGSVQLKLRVLLDQIAERTVCQTLRAVAVEQRHIVDRRSIFLNLLLLNGFAHHVRIVTRLNNRTGQQAEQCKYNRTQRNHCHTHLAHIGGKRTSAQNCGQYQQKNQVFSHKHPKSRILNVNRRQHDIKLHKQQNQKENCRQYDASRLVFLTVRLAAEKALDRIFDTACLSACILKRIMTAKRTAVLSERISSLPKWVIAKGPIVSILHL